MKLNKSSCNNARKYEDIIIIGDLKHQLCQPEKTGYT